MEYMKGLRTQVHDIDAHEIKPVEGVKYRTILVN